MKVLLIRPQAPNKLSFIKILDNEPLELEYLQTALNANNIDSYIYDGLFEKISVKDTIIRENPQVVAVTGYITQQNLMIHYCNIAKAINSNIITVVGGVHAQLNYENFYDDNIDYICRSEDPFVLPKLIKAAAKGEGLDNLNGLIYKNKNERIINEMTTIDINTLPIPSRSFFNQHKAEYRYLELTEVGTIKTSFSCPYDCNFCYCTHLSGGHYQVRELPLIIEELQSMDCQNVQIVDDDFLVDEKRIREFIDLIKENHISKTFICYGRADFIARHPDLIKDLADIGFRYFLVGLEAVNNSQLEAMNKNTTLDDNLRCVEVINQTSAHCIALMIATIDADKDYFQGIWSFVKKTGLIYVTVSVFTPIPGTRLYEEYKDKIQDEDITSYDFLHLVLEPEKLTKIEFYKEYRRLFWRLYNRAKTKGCYDFMDMKFYKNMLSSYFRRKIRGV